MKNFAYSIPYLFLFGLSEIFLCGCTFSVTNIVSTATSKDLVDENQTASTDFEIPVLKG